MKVEVGQTWIHTCTGMEVKVLAVQEMYQQTDSKPFRVVVAQVQGEHKYMSGVCGYTSVHHLDFFKQIHHRTVRLTDEIERLLDEKGIQI